MISLDFASLLQGKYAGWLIAGALKTILLFSVSWVIAFLLSLVIAALRSCGVKLFQALMFIFVGYHRNVPGLVQLFVWYFGIPQLLPQNLQSWINANGSEFIYGCIALSLNAAAYMSEDIRSGIRSLPTAQFEAARALGLTYLSSMRKIILPQAVRIAVPPLVNQTLGLLKSTSLAMIIGVAEMTYTSHQIENESFKTFEAFAIASIFYWSCSFLLIGLGTALNRYLRLTGVD